MRIFSILLGAAAIAAVAVPAFAHHSFAMFDGDKTTTWTGKVVAFRWANPHAHVLVDVQSSDGAKAGRWDFEGGSPNIMARQGWRKTSFKAGDAITIVGHPMRDGSKGASLYYAVGADGKRLYHDVNRSGGPANAR